MLGNFSANNCRHLGPRHMLEANLDWRTGCSNHLQPSAKSELDRLAVFPIDATGRSASGRVLCTGWCLFGHGFAAEHGLTQQSAYLAISLLECVGIHLQSYAWVRVTETASNGPHIGARGDCGGCREVP